MAPSLSEAELALHRYFVWASRMKDLASTCGPQPQSGLEQKLWRQRFLSYAALWLSLLYVVCEGWSELKLQDEEVDELLRSPHVDLLRRFRNGAFHFQAKYFDDRTTEFFASDEPATWALALHTSIGAWFMRRSAELEAERGEA